MTIHFPYGETTRNPRYVAKLQSEHYDFALQSGQELSTLLSLRGADEAISRSYETLRPNFDQAARSFRTQREG
jgi:hypothetical protein